VPRARFAALIRVVAGAAIVMLLPAAAHAGSCTVATTSISFGSYNVFSTAPVDSTATITYRCNGGATVAIGITTGQSGSFNPRVMAKGLEQLGYNLYLDAAHSTVWGDSSSGSQLYFDPNPPNNHNVTVTVYGRMPAGQDAGAGAYSDSVTVVVLF
jgi:spore coat protein U-like protein